LDPLQAESGAPSVLPRRRFLAVCGKVAGSLVGVGVVLVVARSFYPPLRRWIRLPPFMTPFRPIAAIDSLPPGEWKLVPLVSADTADAKSQPDQKSKTDAKSNTEGPAVWVRRDRDQPEKFRVLSPICTHQGCIVKWRADRSLFVCPCHGGTFDAEGNRKSGPPQSPLAMLDYRVNDGQLLIRGEDG
jgi:nitrite reductase/ring-hydroxylating ferredoxin subunit